MKVFMYQDVYLENKWIYVLTNAKIKKIIHNDKSHFSLKLGF